MAKTQFAVRESWSRKTGASTCKVRRVKPPIRLKAAEELVEAYTKRGAMNVAERLYGMRCGKGRR